VQQETQAQPGESEDHDAFEAMQKGAAMADNTPAGAVDTGADMDYREHEKTYSMFLALAKYSALACSAVLIAMAAGFFWGFGFISATILFVLICAVGAFLLR